VADTNTLLPEPVLVAKRQPLQLSTPLQSFRFPKEGGASSRYAGLSVRLISPSTSGAHKPPSHRTSELVRCVSDRLLITDIWIGEGELNFPEAYGEELEVLEPLKVGRGYRFSFSYSVTDIEVLAGLTAWQSRLMLTSAFRVAAGINKSTHFNQINCGWFR